MRSTELHVRLYPTDQMRVIVERLYVQLLLFMRQAVKWYARGTAGRAISSIFRPFELSYQGMLEEIRICANQVEGEGLGALKAEVRGMHVEAQILGQRFHDIERKLVERDRNQDQRFDGVDQKLAKIQCHALETTQKLISK